LKQNFVQWYDLLVAMLFDVIITSIPDLILPASPLVSFRCRVSLTLYPSAVFFNHFLAQRSIFAARLVSDVISVAG